MGQILGTLTGLIVAFVMCFLLLTFGALMPSQLIDAATVLDFLSSTDLEIRLAVVGTVLYPPLLGTQLGVGAQSSTVLMFLAWGTGGLIAGLMTRNVPPAVFAAVFSVIIGAFLTWLLVFFINTLDFAAIFGGESLLLLQFVLEGCLYPVIAAGIGGALGGAITRER
ncbi:MAG: hypothetical protein HXY34_08410 [Candidatus Thorarchaeota archaeon]|nr:hypothetical protein [Candidatus Thorarchaeota archaeon]